ncbi:hypothetical protein COLO4_28244 [Corchorus olitorius]|uniref:Uncharacterized protein n=1 Tax=Corchorus olitorius TaxID=93759 RepID=A0A1R3HMC8_9ROSI|nr:hypothetical protein COLO4_28244 [Corchorus olitorius]
MGYASAMKEKYGNAAATHDFDPQIWSKVVGGIGHGYLYGFGREDPRVIMGFHNLIDLPHLYPLLQIAATLLNHKWSNGEASIGWNLTKTSSRCLESYGFPTSSSINFWRWRLLHN